MCVTTQIEIDVTTVQQQNAIVGEVVITRKQPHQKSTSKLLYVVDFHKSLIMLHGAKGAVLTDPALAVDEIRDKLHDLKIDDSMYSVVVA